MTDNAERIVRNCYNTAMSFLSELQKPQNAETRKSRAAETESRDVALKTDLYFGKNFPRSVQCMCS